MKMLFVKSVKGAKDFFRNGGSLHVEACSDQFDGVKLTLEMSGNSRKAKNTDGYIVYDNEVDTNQKYDDIFSGDYVLFKEEPFVFASTITRYECESRFWTEKRRDIPTEY